MSAAVLLDQNNHILRLGQGMRLSWTVFLSFVGHILFLALFLKMPKPSPQAPLLVPVSWVSLDRPPHAVPLTPQPPSPPLTPIQNSPPPVQKKIAMPPPVTPIILPSPPQPDAPTRTPVETPALSDTTPRANNITTSLPSTTASLPQNTGEAQTVSILSLGDASGIEGPLSKYAYYFEGIQSKISAFWIVPSDDALQQQGKPLAVVIGFVVQRNGQIRKKTINVEKSSGHPFWDASALRAIYNADPLLPLPHEMTEELHIHFEFKFHL